MNTLDDGVEDAAIQRTDAITKIFKAVFDELAKNVAVRPGKNRVGSTLI